MGQSSATIVDVLLCRPPHRHHSLLSVQHNIAFSQCMCPVGLTLCCVVPTALSAHNCIILRCSHIRQPKQSRVRCNGDFCARSLFHNTCNTHRTHRRIASPHRVRNDKFDCARLCCRVCSFHISTTSEALSKRESGTRAKIVQGTSSKRACDQ